MDINNIYEVNAKIKLLFQIRRNIDFLQKLQNSEVNKTLVAYHGTLQAYFSDDEIFFNENIVDKLIVALKEEEHTVESQLKIL